MRLSAREAGGRVFVLDLAAGRAGALPLDAKTWTEASSAGPVREGYPGANPGTGGWRVSLEFEPVGAAAADLNCALMGEQGPLPETWSHRWVAFGRAPCGAASGVVWTGVF